MTKSSIYLGKLTHIRQGEIDNQFTYPLNMYAIDLDELNELHNNVSSFSYNKLNLLSIWDKDYLTPEKLSIKEKLLSLLNKEGCGDNIQQIILLTNPRYLNYVFNPMSAYYCFTPTGSLRCCVVEINNTFGDKHVYIVDNPVSKPTEDVIGHFKVTKGFHVSPFYDLKGEYEFKFSDIREKMILTFDMNNGQTIFHAFLKGNRKIPFNQTNVLKTLLKYPINAWLTMPRILWQAAKLYFIKKLPVFTRPKPLDTQHTIRVGIQPMTFTQKMGKKIIVNQLSYLKKGNLKVEFPDGTQAQFGDGSGEEIKLNILNNYFYSKILWRGKIGFGESFVDHDWETNNLPSLLTLLGEGIPHLSNRWIEFPAQIIANVKHFLRKNSVHQAKKNIHDHYNIMNEMFFLFLDKRKVYSCAIYMTSTDTLEQAQLNKIQTLIKKTNLKKEDHVLEIGFGWGSFAIEAVKATGCHLTGITISENQLNYVRDLINQEGLQDQITLKLLDYRKENDLYDKIVSIEMIEAVGRQFLSTYFQKAEQLLKPGGIFALQAITYDDNLYENYKHDTDWIKEYIFPGSHIPSMRLIEDIVRRDTTFEILSKESIGKSYVRTLAEWSSRFKQNEAALKKLGFDETFMRKWIFYFSYCEAGFRLGLLDDYQIILKKPERESV